VLVQDDVYTPSTTARIAKTEDYEVIIDDPSPGRGVKQVSHRKIHVESFDSGYTAYGTPFEYYIEYIGTNVNWWQWLVYGVSAPVTIPRPSTNSVRFTPVGDQDSLVRDTVDAFYSRNITDNLLNTIEAPQLANSLSSMKSTLSAVRSRILRDGLLKSWQGLRNYYSHDRLNRMLGSFGRAGRSAAGLYLLWNFGLAPLISDMRKIERECKRLKADIKREISKKRDKLSSVHRQVGYDYSYIDGDGHDVSYLDVSGLRYSVKLNQEKSKRICTVRGHYGIDYDNPTFRQLDYLLGKFGVTGPASLVWELIPYSFVVDWFLDLRHITNVLDNLLTGSTKRIVDICISDKIVYTESGLLNPSGYSPVGKLEDVMSIVSNSVYTREPIHTYKKVGLSGRFGKKQASLTAALLYQNVASLITAKR
jgi:hypothetical protein